jgi:hypothetical protein
MISEEGRQRKKKTHPMIQMMAPTKETMTARSAKGRPSSHPRGRHSPSLQHILDQPQSIRWRRPPRRVACCRVLRWSLSCFG